MVQKIYSKVYPVLCTNTHHDVTYLVNQWMVINTKTWISREGNITFLWNKKILNLCIRWHIWSSYRFVAEVTFKFNSSNAFILLQYKSENILKASDSSCIKSCLHCDSAFNLFIFSFITSVNSISSSTLFFANKIYKFLIGSLNFHISSYSPSISVTCCSLIG